jgi:hypothetical protein
MAYSLSGWFRPIVVAETDTFVRQSADIWTDEERMSFVDFIARNPEAGDLIQETGGVRKVRWGRGGSGKRGGTRVVYFYYHADAPLYLLMVYAKARKEDLTPAEKKSVRAFTATLKLRYPRRRE